MGGDEGEGVGGEEGVGGDEAQKLLKKHGSCRFMKSRGYTQLLIQVLHFAVQYIHVELYSYIINKPRP